MTFRGVWFMSLLHTHEGVARVEKAPGAEGIASGAFPLGANFLGARGCSFLVWAPKAKRVEVCLTAPTREAWREQVVPLHPAGLGYYQALAEGIGPGARYFYRLDGELERPDPASRFQPEGVHAASAIIDPAFEWSDQGWFGLPLRDYILYELHVGTFTEEGTFEAVIAASCRN